MQIRVCRIIVPSLQWGKQGAGVEPVQEMTHQRCQLGFHQPGAGDTSASTQTERKTTTASEKIKSGDQTFLGSVSYPIWWVWYTFTCAVNFSLTGKKKQFEAQFQCRTLCQFLHMNREDYSSTNLRLLLSMNETQLGNALKF